MEVTMKFHQGACLVPSFQHITIGTSKGALVHVSAVDQFLGLPETASSGSTTEISDLCFCAAISSVVSVHANGDLRVWQVQASGGYENNKSITATGEAPIRVVSLGVRLAVAFGPGTICLYDALSCELQAELTAHARWITALSSIEETGQLASVGEDTVINVWRVEPSSGQISVQHSSVVTDKLLTGVAFCGSRVAVTA